MGGRYSFQEIVSIFPFIKNENPKLPPKIYDRFCEQISYAPRDIIDSAIKDVEFVLLPFEGQQREIACCIYVERVLSKGKKWIIVLTPCILGYGRKLNKLARIQKTLHELAHFHLGHKEYLNDQHYMLIESQADNLANKWLIEGLHALGLRQRRTRR